MEGPDTIYKLRYAADAALAMLAGMQLDVFTPLKNGPMTADQIGDAIGVNADRLRLLLYALVAAELLEVKDGFSLQNACIDLHSRASPRLMFEKARKAAQTLGQTITGRHVGYASNANQLADTGVELLVGLGPYGGGMHTDQEFMSIAAYEKRLQLGIELIRSLTRSR